MVSIGVLSIRLAIDQLRKGMNFPAAPLAESASCGKEYTSLRQMQDILLTVYRNADKVGTL